MLPKKLDWNRIYSLPLISTLGPVCTGSTFEFTVRVGDCTAAAEGVTRSVRKPHMVSCGSIWRTLTLYFSPAVKRRTDLLTRSGSDLAGLTLNIFVMSSELRCWATSHSLAVMSMRLQMSMSTLLAFSWIFESSSDICWRTEEKPIKITCVSFIMCKIDSMTLNLDLTS